MDVESWSWIWCERAQPGSIAYKPSPASSSNRTRTAPAGRSRRVGAAGSNRHSRPGTTAVAGKGSPSSSSRKPYKPTMQSLRNKIQTRPLNRRRPRTSVNNTTSSSSPASTLPPLSQSPSASPLSSSPSAADSIGVTDGDRRGGGRASSSLRSSLRPSNSSSPPPSSSLMDLTMPLRTLLAATPLSHASFKAFPPGPDPVELKRQILRQKRSGVIEPPLTGRPLSQPLTMIQVTTRMSDALWIMNSRNTSVAPVRDSYGDILGWIHLSDVIYFIMSVVDSPTSISTAQLHSLLIGGVSYVDATVKQVLAARVRRGIDQARRLTAAATSGAALSTLALQQNRALGGGSARRGEGQQPQLGGSGRGGERGGGGGIKPKSRGRIHAGGSGLATTFRARENSSMHVLSLHPNDSALHALVHLLTHRTHHQYAVAVDNVSSSTAPEVTSIVSLQSFLPFIVRALAPLSLDEQRQHDAHRHHCAQLASGRNSYSAATLAAAELSSREHAVRVALAELGRTPLRECGLAAVLSRSRQAGATVLTQQQQLKAATAHALAAGLDDDELRPYESIALTRDEVEEAQRTRDASPAASLASPFVSERPASFVVVTDKLSVINALHILQMQQACCLALTDDRGRLFAQFCETDLDNMFIEDLVYFQDRVIPFCQSHASKRQLSRNGNSSSSSFSTSRAASRRGSTDDGAASAPPACLAPVVVDPSQTLHETLAMYQRIAPSQVAWTVDQRYAPNGMLTLPDVLWMALRQPVR